MNFFRRNIKSGKYKIYLLDEEKMLDLFNFIKENTSIKKVIENKEIVFEINERLVLQKCLKEHTNLKKYLDIDESFDAILVTWDSNIKYIIIYFNTLISCLIETAKLELINSLNQFGDALKEFK